MKHILKVEPIQANKADYFDEVKKIYHPTPVFPFLTEEDINAGIDELIDETAFEAEIKELHEKSKTNNSTIEGSNYIICLVKWHEYPELIKMLTIIREWAFRNDGGGVGSNDYDEFDLKPEMEQLIIVNPEYQHLAGAIIGGYRYVIHNKDTYKSGPMGDHFYFSEKWKSEQWIELGRSFTNPYLKKYDKRPSIDYVLHGLGYIFASYPKSAGFFGKVTLFYIYEELRADAFFLAVAKEYWNKTEDIYVNPEERVPEGTLTAAQRKILDKDIFKGLFYILRKEFQLNLVKIMAVYNRMCPLNKIYYFGGFRHHAFGDTTEVGIAIHIDDVYQVIKDKFVTPYL